MSEAKPKFLRDLPPREPYEGNDKELLMRLAELKVAKVELMIDWQDYNRRTDNSLSWKRYNSND